MMTRELLIRNAKDPRLVMWDTCMRGEELPYYELTVRELALECLRLRDRVAELETSLNTQTRREE